ncbi:hypothetical protein [Viridibacterium curvum]|uniref:Fimbrial assembly protein n=1 Tax=Viridibacterium curvum TaxID=1101404 RepID=A0ABP9QDD9_9RHOO
MKPMHIDFAPVAGWWEAGSDKGRRPLWWLLCLLLVAAFVTACMACWQMAGERDRAVSRKTSIAAELDRASQGSGEDDLAKIESAEAVAHASQHLNYPWATLIDSLEKNNRQGVNIMSMEFGIVRQSNKMVIEASELGAGLDYLEALKAAPGFNGLVLARQEAVMVDGGQRIRFTLDAPQPVKAEKQARTEGGAQ